MDDHLDVTYADEMREAIYHAIRKSSGSLEELQDRLLLATLKVLTKAIDNERKIERDFWMNEVAEGN